MVRRLSIKDTGMTRETGNIPVYRSNAFGEIDPHCCTHCIETYFA